MVLPVSIGKHTYFADGIERNILSWNEPNAFVEIGFFCSIAKGAKILTGGEHFKQRVSQFPFSTINFIATNAVGKEAFSKGKTVIGSDVWIGLNAIILSGVKIGNGAVIGAGAVISKNVPDYAIAVGNPQKIVGYRFSKEQIKKLLSIAWWNWGDEKIKENIEWFYKSPKEFIDKFYKK